MGNTNDLIYEFAKADIGTWEWAGGENNPKVIAYYREAGHGEVKQDSVPWCAAFVGAILAKSGVRNTGSLLARSYEQWGEKVDGLDNAKRGDVVVISRGDKSWQGHVGFYHGHGAGKIHILGGNQGDQVNITPYDAGRLVAIRRAPQPRQSKAESKTIQGTVLGGASVAGSAATTVGSTLGFFNDTAQIVALCFLGVAALAFMWIARERIRKWAGGDT